MICVSFRQRSRTQRRSSQNFPKNRPVLDTTQRSAWSRTDWLVRRRHAKLRCALRSLTTRLTTGTGVFNSAGIVFPNTQSIGLSLLLWVFGALFALSGVVVYIELGLTIPRWPFGPDGEKISTPRSGDALNYVSTYSNSSKKGSWDILVQLHAEEAHVLRHMSLWNSIHNSRKLCPQLDRIRILRPCRIKLRSNSWKGGCDSYHCEHLLLPATRHLQTMGHHYQ